MSDVRRRRVVGRVLGAGRGVRVGAGERRESTRRVRRRIGAARWKRLHRLAYVAAAAGVLHYYLLVKADTRQPLAFAWVLGGLLGYRVLARWVPALRRSRRAAAPVAKTSAA